MGFFTLEIVVTFRCVCLSPERDLAVEVGVIDPPNTGCQTVQLHTRERLLEQRAEAGQIDCETVNFSGISQKTWTLSLYPLHVTIFLSFHIRHFFPFFRIFPKKKSYLFRSLPFCLF